MTSPNSDFLSLHISTDAFPAKNAAEAFREIFAKTILQIEMEPIGGHELKLDMMLRGLPNFGMANCRTAPARYPHTSSLINSDDIVLVVIHDGHSEFQRRGCKMDLRAGDTVATTIGEPATFTFPEAATTTNLRFSRELLTPYLADLGKTLSQPKLQQGPALDLLLSYANILRDNDALATPALRLSIVSHMHDLAALAIGATRDGQELAQGRGVRAARLHTIKAEILENLGQHDLVAASVADRHGITPRYVNMLFEADGISFSEFVLAERLKRAHRMLSDPRFDSHTISTIAFEIGFSDLSYFNRTYRRRFGMTPTDARSGRVR